MAIVTGPLHSAEARGSVGALTYTTWRGRSVVKARAGPATQYSQDQLAVRALTHAALHAWSDLDDDTRAAWKHFANAHPEIDWTGNPKRLTGQNWFVRINVRRQLLSLAITSTVPPWMCSTELTSLVLTGGVPDVGVWWTPSTPRDPGDHWVEVYASDAHTAARHPNLPETDRKIAEPLNLGAASWLCNQEGYYTAFARAISANGTVGPWRRCVGYVSS